MSTCEHGCIRGRILIEGVGLVDCPKCRNITRVLEEPDESGLSFYDKLEIPPQYKNFGTSGEELFKIPEMESYSTSSISEVAGLMERINQDLYSGRVTSLSCYIYVPNVVDIKRFVYGAQKLALEKGLGVTPFISCNMLYGIQKVGDYSVRSLKDEDLQHDLKNIPPELVHAVDGYRIVQRTKLTYFDFIHADLCFIDATANTSELGWAGLADLLGERAKRGLPTYVIGYWPSRGTSGTNKAFRSLKFLLVNGYGNVRLDLLVPYELKSKRSEKAVEIKKTIEPESTKSSVLAGLSQESLMG